MVSLDTVTKQALQCICQYKDCPPRQLLDVDFNSYPKICLFFPPRGAVALLLGTVFDPHNILYFKRINLCKIAGVGMLGGGEGLAGGGGAGRSNSKD